MYFSYIDLCLVFFFDFNYFLEVFMLNLLIRYITTIFCVNDIYTKLLHMQDRPKYLKIAICIFTLFITVLSYVLPSTLQFMVLPVLIFIMFIYLAFFTTTRPETIFTTLILSFSICYFLFFLSLCIVYGVICIPVYVCFKKTLHYLVSQLLIAYIQLLILPLPFRIKRLQKGMPFLHNQLFSQIGTFIGAFILFCSMIISTSNTKVSSTKLKFHLLLVPFIFLLAIFIFIWWRNQIQQSYLLRLKDRDYKRLEEQFKLCREKLSALEKENQALSKLIHRDNKLIPSMQLALHQLLEMELKETTSENVLKKGNSLLAQLEQEMVDRNGIVMKLSCSEKKLESSGISSIDCLLTYMQQKSINKKIVFKVLFKKEVLEMLQDVITETNCLTILADLIENAQIAIKSASKKGHILLEMGKGENFYEIHVWDDGIPFTKEVLFHLGKKNYTTHKKENGSGIGIMNTYSLLQAAHASLVIDERNNMHPIYTKKVSIIFDQKLQYRLLTSRSKKEIEYLTRRNDLIITSK